MTLDLKKGDPWPFQSSRGLVGSPIDPVWHALITAPQAERKTSDRLKNAGVEVKYPTLEKVRHIHGQRKTFILPQIPRIIYAKFRYQPNWDVLRDRRVISGVFSHGDTPIALSGDDIARVMGLPTEAERLEQEMIEAARPRVGEKAEIVDGIMGGFFVNVTRVEFGRVWWEMASGLKGEISEGGIRRVV